MVALPRLLLPAAAAAAVPPVLLLQELPSLLPLLL